MKPCNWTIQCTLLQYYSVKYNECVKFVFSHSTTYDYWFHKAVRIMEVILYWYYSPSYRRLCWRSEIISQELTKCAFLVTLICNNFGCKYENISAELCGEHHVIYCIQKTTVVLVNSYSHMLVLLLPPCLHTVIWSVYCSAHINVIS